MSLHVSANVVIIMCLNYWARKLLSSLIAYVVPSMRIYVVKLLLSVCPLCAQACLSLWDVFSPVVCCAACLFLENRK
jgi:hypothetical protein